MVLQSEPQSVAFSWLETEDISSPFYMTVLVEKISKAHQFLENEGRLIKGALGWSKSFTYSSPPQGRGHSLFNQFEVQLLCRDTVWTLQQC